MATSNIPRVIRYRDIVSKRFLVINDNIGFQTTIVVIKLSPLLAFQGLLFLHKQYTLQK